MEIDHQPETEYLLHRRFDRMARLVGDENMQKILRSHVMVIGLGGVGSWAAESLARSGVGHLTLVDFDDICTTNTNRQLHSMTGLIGHKKAEVMAERIRKINPQCLVEPLVKFYSDSTSDEIFSCKPDYIIDAIDNIKAKTHLLSSAKRYNVKIVCCGGTGGKMDPSQLRWKDLSETSIDPFLHQIRKDLRSRYDFSADGAWGIPCLFSNEAARQPLELKYDKGKGFKCVCPQGAKDLHSCERRNIVFGTASFLTGSVGLGLASYVVRNIVEEVKWGEF